MPLAINEIDPSKKWLCIRNNSTNNVDPVCCYKIMSEDTFYTEAQL